jgi:hypothetical protein
VAGSSVDCTLLICHRLTTAAAAAAARGCSQRRAGAPGRRTLPLLAAWRGVAAVPYVGGDTRFNINLQLYIAREYSIRSIYEY